MGACFLHEALCPRVLLTSPRLRGGVPPRGQDGRDDGGGARATPGGLRPRDAAQIMWALAVMCGSGGPPAAPPAELSPSAPASGQPPHTSSSFSTGRSTGESPQQQQQEGEAGAAQRHVAFAAPQPHPPKPLAASVHAVLALALMPANDDPPLLEEQHQQQQRERWDAAVLDDVGPQVRPGWDSLRRVQGSFRTPHPPHSHAALGVDSNAQDLACLFWSLARLRYDPGPPLRRRLLAALVRLLKARRLCARSLPVVLWSLARLPWRVPPQLAHVLLGAAAQHGARLGAQGVAMAFTFAGRQWPAWRMSSAHARALLHAVCCPDAAAAADDEGLPQAAEPSAAAAEAAVAWRWRSQSAAPLHCRTAAVLLCGLARARVRPSAGWMRCLFQASAQVGTRFMVEEGSQSCERRQDVS